MADRIKPLKLKSSAPAPTGPGPKPLKLAATLAPAAVPVAPVKAPSGPKPLNLGPVKAAAPVQVQEASPAPKPLNLKPKKEFVNPVTPVPAPNVAPRAMSTGNRMLDEALAMAQNTYPNAWPLSGTMVRKLLPLTMNTVLEAGREQLDRIAAVVRDSTAIHQNLDDLQAPESFERILREAQGRTTEPKGFLSRFTSRLVEPLSRTDPKIAVQSLSTALRSFPTRSAAVQEESQKFQRELVAVVAAIASVAFVAQESKDEDVQRLLGTLDDRRRILLQSVAQIQLVPTQLKVLDQKVATLLNQADQLITVTLPALEANR